MADPNILNLVVKSTNATVASVNLKGYAQDVWHVLEIPLDYTDDPTGDLSHIAIEDAAAAYAGKSISLKICPNDTGQICTPVSAPNCLWCSVYPDSWDAVEGAWIFVNSLGGQVAFLQPALLNGAEWWKNPRPDSLTMEIKTATPAEYGMDWAKVYVKSDLGTIVATVDLEPYENEMWNTITVPLNWALAPTGILTDIYVESYIYGTYEFKLRICSNDTGNLCGY